MKKPTNPELFGKKIILETISGKKIKGKIVHHEHADYLLCREYNIYGLAQVGMTLRNKLKAIGYSDVYKIVWSKIKNVTLRYKPVEKKEEVKTASGAIVAKKDIKTSDHGRPFEATILRTRCTGKICYRDGDAIYLCQNMKSGSHAPNKFGYKHSWYWDTDVNNFRFTDVVKKEEKKAEPLKAGDILCYTATKSTSVFTLGFINELIAIVVVSPKGSNEYTMSYPISLFNKAFSKSGAKKNISVSKKEAISIIAKVKGVSESEITID